jgi:HK97 family phage portal protein
VLEGGAKWNATGITNEQAQFLETRKFTAGQIAAMLFRLDPADIGIGVEGSSITYANLEQRNTRRVQVALMPWVIRLEAALSTLVPGRQLKFNLNGLLRADLKTRYESYAIGVKSKFLVPNEPRGWENLDPLPGGDEVVEVAPSAPSEGAQNG